MAIKSSWNNPLVKILIFSAVILVLCNLVACSPKVTSSKSVVTTDTSYTIQTSRDSIVFIPKDAIKIENIILYCDSDNIVKMPKIDIKSKTAFIKAEVKNNVLSIEAGCDSLEVVVKQLTIENTR